jgi:glycosyltransferase involved in cell wall biosynthesis
MRDPHVAVVIPAYQEARLIGPTIASVPPSVAEIIVVDDASDDGTSEAALGAADPRVVVVRHEANQGVGAAIYTGYQHALHGAADIFVVMAGDNQMDGADLPRLLAPILEGRADYVKGNRLLHAEVTAMPRLRRWGTRTLAWLTTLAAGTVLGDTQCGYTAISRKAALGLRWDQLWPRYGYPNDLLIHLISRGHRICETSVRPVYATEQSGLRVWHFFSILGVIARRVLLERTHRQLEKAEEKLLSPER